MVADDLGFGVLWILLILLVVLLGMLLGSAVKACMFENSAEESFLSPVRKKWHGGRVVGGDAALDGFNNVMTAKKFNSMAAWDKLIKITTDKGRADAIAPYNNSVNLKLLLELPNKNTTIANKTYQVVNIISNSLDTIRRDILELIDDPKSQAIILNHIVSGFTAQGVAPYAIREMKENPEMAATILLNMKNALGIISSSELTRESSAKMFKTIGASKKPGEQMKAARLLAAIDENVFVIVLGQANAKSKNIISSLEVSEILAEADSIDFDNLSRNLQKLSVTKSSRVSKIFNAMNKNAGVFEKAVALLFKMDEARITAVLENSELQSVNVSLILAAAAAADMTKFAKCLDALAAGTGILANPDKVALIFDFMGAAAPAKAEALLAAMDEANIKAVLGNDKLTSVNASNILILAKQSSLVNLSKCLDALASMPTKLDKAAQIINEISKHGAILAAHYLSEMSEVNINSVLLSKELGVVQASSILAIASTPIGIDKFAKGLNTLTAASPDKAAQIFDGMGAAEAAALFAKMTDPSKIAILKNTNILPAKASELLQEDSANLLDAVFNDTDPATIATSPAKVAAIIISLCFIKKNLCITLLTQMNKTPEVLNHALVSAANLFDILTEPPMFSHYTDIVKVMNEVKVAGVCGMISDIYSAFRLLQAADKSKQDLILVEIKKLNPSLAEQLRELLTVPEEETQSTPFIFHPTTAHSISFSVNPNSLESVPQKESLSVTQKESLSVTQKESLSETQTKSQFENQKESQTPSYSSTTESQVYLEFIPDTVYDVNTQMTDFIEKVKNAAAAHVPQSASREVKPEFILAFTNSKDAKNKDIAKAAKANQAAQLAHILGDKLPQIKTGNTTLNGAVYTFRVYRNNQGKVTRVESVTTPTRKV